MIGQQQLNRQLGDFVLKVTCPLVWHDRMLPWPRKLFGATCFFVRTDSRIFGITAAHVVEAFKNSVNENRNIVCQLRVSENFDLIENIIDINLTADLSTFSVSESVLQSTGVVCLDCRNGNWPPPVPEIMTPISLCGFPEHMRTAGVGPTANFEAWGALAVVDSITDKEIIVTYDPNRDLPSVCAPELPPLGMNLSGCSGGPVIMHYTKGGLHRWAPVAIITGGPLGAGTGVSAEFDMIRLRRIDSILEDGTIRQANIGWLPS